MTQNGLKWILNTTLVNVTCNPVFTKVPQFIKIAVAIYIMVDVSTV